MFVFGPFFINVFLDDPFLGLPSAGMWKDKNGTAGVCQPLGECYEYCWRILKTAFWVKFAVNGFGGFVILGLRSSCNLDHTFGLHSWLQGRFGLVKAVVSVPVGQGRKK